MTAMQLRTVVPLVVASAIAGCSPAAPAPRASPSTIDVRPIGGANVAESGAPAPIATCTIEGDGEPEDRIMFHTEEDLLVFGARGDALPLVRIEGRGRNTLHGRWTDLASEDSDGRAHLLLEQAGSYRISGFAQLHATRFRLRRRTSVVGDHLWLEPDFIVRVAGARGARARVVAAIPFHAPREVSAEIPCADLAYDGNKERVTEPPLRDDGHIGRIELYDAPGGERVFEGDTGLVFVQIDEERDGFLRVRGSRHGVSIAGWMPRALVSHAPQGSGGPSGGRSFHGSHQRGLPARVLRTTPLYAERAGVRVVIGEIDRGTEVRILGTIESGSAIIEISGVEVRPVEEVTLRIAGADLERN